jgi:putative transposase
MPPGRKPSPIELSATQRRILERIVRCQTCPQRNGRRARLILEAATGLDNQSIATLIGMNRGTIQLWRNRWSVAQKELALVEREDDEELLEQKIEAILSDNLRPGGPTTFTPEQICQIVALACEKPEGSDRPVTHWTPKELADEAVKRGIVEQISPRTIGRFLKGG